MKKMLISEAAKIIGGELVNAKEVYITGGCIDSRKAYPGALFVAFKGENTDGHKYIDKALENGAVAAIVSYVPEGTTCPCILVENPYKALQDLAEYYRKSLDIKVVGVSGSVGKTSTKEIVASVLAAKYKVHKTVGNYNNEIGLPLTVLDIEEGTEVAVLEMGISDFNEMRVLSKVARPDVCVLTNIGEAHLEALGSRDGILKAKTEMFEYMNEGAAIFVCGDDDKLATLSLNEDMIPCGGPSLDNSLMKVKASKLVHYGFDSKNDVYGKNVKSLKLAGSTFTIAFKDRDIDASIKIIGEHMVLNAVVASAVGNYLSLTDEEIIRGLKEADTIKGRCHLEKFGKGFIIDDCYNASPKSMKESVNILELGEGRKILVLGDMLELGAETEKMHYEIGLLAAEHEFDKAILVGELSKNIYDAMMSSKDRRIKEVIHLDTTDELVSKANELIEADSNVMFKASNGMGFKKVIGKLLNVEY